MGNRLNQLKRYAICFLLYSVIELVGSYIMEVLRGGWIRRYDLYLSFAARF
jgi:hypothetical protein